MNTFAVCMLFLGAGVNTSKCFFFVYYNRIIIQKKTDDLHKIVIIFNISLTTTKMALARFAAKINQKDQLFIVG